MPNHATYGRRRHNCTRHTELKLREKELKKENLKNKWNLWFLPSFRSLT